MASLRLPPLPSIRDIIRLYRLSAKKQLSQNFLLNERITDKIVKHTGRIPGSCVLEVGPGPGAITRSIIRRSPKRLIVVEKDQRFKPTLKMLQNVVSETDGKMDVIIDNIMNVNMVEIFKEEEQRNWEDYNPNIYLVGNLPFNISTILILNWIHDISERRSIWSHGRVGMTLTFQKEVAQRLVAEVTDEQRCRLSIMAQAWTKPKLKFIIPGNQFVPKPDVDVGVVSFVPLIKPQTRHEFKFFEKINRHMFSFRQKYCVACAGTLFPPDCRKQLAELMCKLADVNTTTRPFNLTVEDMDRLASAYKYICEKHPGLEKYNYIASRKVLPQKMTKSISITDYIEDDEFDESQYALQESSI